MLGTGQGTVNNTFHSQSAAQSFGVSRPGAREADQSRARAGLSHPVPRWRWSARATGRLSSLADMARLTCGNTSVRAKVRTVGHVRRSLAARGRAGGRGPGSGMRKPGVSPNPFPANVYNDSISSAGRHPP